MTMTCHRESGFALVTALWAALILATISSYLIGASRTDTRIARTIRLQAEQRAVAEAVINLVELRLFGGNQSHLPLDGAAFSVSYAGAVAHVKIQDQAGLIDLNRAPADMLKRLLAARGELDSMTSQTFTDRILDWREKGIGRRLNGAKKSDYADAGYAYAPRQGPFEALAELKLVMGMTPAIYERIAPDLTVYAQTPSVDIQVAPLDVLEIIPGMDAEMVANLLAKRATRDSGQATAGLLDSATARVVEISVNVGDMKGVQTRLRTTLRVTGEQSSPRWIYVPENE